MLLGVLVILGIRPWPYEDKIKIDGPRLIYVLSLEDGEVGINPVSYTHLTLPTIYAV